MPRGHFTRIESEISPGVPDVYYALTTAGRHDGWIELKSMAAPKTERAKPLKRRGLRKEQVEWIDKHWREGVRIWIFVKLSGMIYCFDGSHAREINSYTFGQIKENCNYSIPLRKPKWYTQLELTKVLTHSREESPISSPSNRSGSIRTARRIRN